VLVGLARSLPCYILIYYSYTDHRYVHSFPTRRSSDLYFTENIALNLIFLSTSPRPYGSSGPPSPGVTPAERADFPAGSSESRRPDRKSTRLNSSHVISSYAVFCLKKKRTMDTLR